MMNKAWTDIELTRAVLDDRIVMKELAERVRKIEIEQAVTKVKLTIYATTGGVVGSSAVWAAVAWFGT